MTGRPSTPLAPPRASVTATIAYPMSLPPFASYPQSPLTKKGKAKLAKGAEKAPGAADIAAAETPHVWKLGRWPAEMRVPVFVCGLVMCDCARRCVKTLPVLRGCVESAVFLVCGLLVLWGG